ncbi:hypothetical protein [Cryobacterium sp. TMT2-23]|uniref:hypothetical protein n=1 Tax=Cryobacterium sp. TMT2-23 TaxID=1259252 RepID=UPI00106BD66A|nr:hypothetical protein [Cryobacterium sp. TMT2-23]TFD29148.1 hypothetical protein E3T32_00295 [Cryobacterium sp. TMT2-23]
METREESIRRPFYAARLRLAEADSFDVQRDELGHMLHQFFRLVEFRGGVEKLKIEPSASTALAILLFRHKNTHRVTRVAEPADVFIDTFTNLFGSLIWDAPPEIASDSRFTAWGTDSMVGKPALETMTEAFNQVLTLPRGNSSSV